MSYEGFIFLLLVSIQALGSDYEISLENARKMGSESSQQVKAAQFNLNASENAYKSTRSGYLPTISLEGSYAEQSHIASFTIPHGPTVQFGTHNNYSVGPVIRYNLYDGGQTSEKMNSSSYEVEVKKAQVKQTMLDHTLVIEQAYISASLAAEELKGTANNFSLANQQYSDISRKASAGSASQLDLLAAKKEVNSYEIMFRQSVLKFGQTLTDLKTQLGKGPDWSQEIPVPKSLKLDTIKFGRPVVAVILDSLDEMRIASVRAGKSDLENHPEIVSYKMEKESLLSLSRAMNSSLYPRFDLFLKANYNYPDQTVLHSYWQNSVGIMFSMPIFESSRLDSDAAKLVSDAQAIEAHGIQRKNELQSSTEKAISSLSSLEEQVKLQEESVLESDKYAKITFETYHLGKAQYIDVQSANAKLLEAKNSAARIKASLLLTLSQLNYLYGSNTEDKK